MKLLVGSGTMAVEYANEADALAALGGALPEKLAKVTVAVFASGPYDREAQRRLPVYLRGKRAGRDGA